MPARDAAPVGAPCWIDLMTSDTARSQEFYSRLFGWVAGEPNEEFGGYFNFTKDGAFVAGCMSSQAAGSEMPDVWSVYLTTDDAAKTVDVAVAKGAQVHVAPMAVADLGTMAVLGDPGGATVGVWQPGLHRGFGIVGEPGAPSWFELHTRDYAGAVDFYRDAFRWEVQVMSDSPELRYTCLVDGEEQLAGVMDSAGFLPEGVPAHWAVYFGVDDADATLATVVDLGGAVVQPAEDTPYGRLATATDPTGAQFKLVAPNEAMPAK